MTALAVALAALASLVFAAAGYLVGVRFGRAAREALRREVSGAEARAAVLERALEDARAPSPEPAAEVLGGMNRIRAELDALARAVETRDEAWAERVRAEVDTLASSMRRDGADHLEQIVRQLDPKAEQARLARALAPRGDDKRPELPRLLATVAREGGFAGVLLADEAGLVLATSPGTQHPDEVAGVSALLLSHGDRLAQRGMPRPTATLVHDAADRLTLHRTLDVQDRRYVLTAVARKETLTHRSLDPAVDVLERVLTRDAWQEA